MYRLKPGTTDRTVTVFIPDPASTDGSGKTGLTHADLTVSYTRVETDNDVTVSDVTSSLSTLTALTDAHADWGVKEVSSTLAPGLYRLDIADAVLASGAWEAVVYVEITSSAAAASPIKILLENDPSDLMAIGADAQSATDLKDFADAGYDPATNKVQGVVLTDTVTTYTGNTPQTGDTYALANGVNGFVATKADTAAILVDTNELQTDWVNGGRLDLIVDAILADTNELQTDWVNGGRLDLIVDATLADTNELQTDWVNGGRLDLIIDSILDDTDLIDDATSGLAKIATDVAAILVDTGTTLQAELDGIQADTEDIQSRLPAALTGAGNMKADALLFNGSAVNDTIETAVGTALAGTDVTDFTAIPAGTPNLLEALGFLYAQGFYRKEQTATTTTLYDGDNNAIAEATTSDNGTTFIRTKFAAP